MGQAFTHVCLPSGAGVGMEQAFTHVYLPSGAGVGMGQAFTHVYLPSAGGGGMWIHSSIHAAHTCMRLHLLTPLSPSQSHAHARRHVQQ